MSGRPTRQSKRRAVSLIEASSVSLGASATRQANMKGLEHFYVGYALDEESPEVCSQPIRSLSISLMCQWDQMIMKKFEEAERLNGNRTELDDAQLQELFKATSNWNDRTLNVKQDAFFDRDTGEFQLDQFLDQVHDYDEGHEGDGFYEAWGLTAAATPAAAPGKRGRKKKDQSAQPKPPKEPKAAKVAKEPKQRVAAAAAVRGELGKSMTKTVRAADGSMLSVKKKLRMRSPDDPLQVRVPLPLPSSWGGAIRSLHALDRDDRLGTTREPRVDQASRSVCAARHNIAADILALDFAALQREHGDFLVVMINVPWRVEKPEWRGFNDEASHCSARRVSVEQFTALDFFPVVPFGFVMVWIEKECLAEVVLHMEARQFVYVENFVWVKLLPNGEPYRGASPVFQKTKATMLIFRKEGPVEMRHQRSSDTVLEIIPPALEDFDTKPESAFEAIETLVPTGVSPRPRLLELWAPLGRAARPGWVSVFDTHGRDAAAHKFVADAQAKAARQADERLRFAVPPPPLEAAAAPPPPPPADLLVLPPPPLLLVPAVPPPPPPLQMQVDEDEALARALAAAEEDDFF